MKKSLLLIAIAGFLMILSFSLKGQEAKPALDQLKLMQQLVGKWQRDWNKDTSEVWEGSQYGKAFVTNVSWVIRGTKSPWRINNCSLIGGKFKGFQLYNGGYSDTWIGSFASDKKFSIEMTKDFVPGSTIYKYDITFDTPDNFTLTRFDKGVKFADYKFYKVR